MGAHATTHALVQYSGHTACADTWCHTGKATAQPCGTLAAHVVGHHLSVSGAMTMAQELDATYPTVARWVMEYGWIEIGQDDMSRSFIRALDEGAWSGKGRPITLPLHPATHDGRRLLALELPQHSTGDDELGQEGW
jgi:hypothetical protein